MKIPVAFFLSILLLAPGDLRVNWKSQAERTVSIRSEVQTSQLEQCLENGFDFQLSYDIQVCKRRGAWFDTCGDIYELVYSVMFDPISEVYTIHRDRMGDGLEGVTRIEQDLESAYRAVSEEQIISLSDLDLPDPEALNSRRAYLSARGYGFCKEEYGRSLSRFTEFLTFGALDYGTFTSGWQDFFLR